MTKRLPHELLSNLKLRIFENKEILGFLKNLELMESPQPAN